MVETAKDVYIREGSIDASGGITVEVNVLAKVAITCRMKGCKDLEKLLEGTVNHIWPEIQLKPPIINDPLWYDKSLIIERVFIGKKEDLLAGEGEHLKLTNAKGRVMFVDKKHPSANLAEEVREFVYM